ncbi:hypothetical protein F0562_035505 [Nyssa sinensis]|uniref:Uncharacterized protein n=1 Tax=Nyssa sinensis TaxID=561372 RepID=A0A5J5ADD3_9ASTE|nr:hypothetical protein F0562_035505 [Nyssa sinensis]
MANRIAVTVTVLFFLFALSYARSPLDFLEKDVIHGDESNSLPESDRKETILLPTEKPESETTIVFELEPEVEDPKPLDTNTQPVESVEDIPVADTDKVVDATPLTRPITVVNFRPINRHIGVKRQFPFRIPHRRCRHHGKPMNPRFHGREVSYGNDMILSGENNDFDQVMFHGGVRQIPAKWVRFHHHHHHDGMPRFQHKHHDMFAKQNFKRPFSHEEEEYEREDKKGREDREDGGFMKRIRKFLNHF